MEAAPLVPFVEFRAKFISPFHVPTVAEALAYLEPLDPGATLLLDLGCGRGEAAEAFAKIGFVVIGIDSNREAIVTADQSTAGITYIEADVHHLPVESGCVDAILSLSLLQYVDVPTVLRECHRVLKPGAKAVFIENLRANPMACVYRVARWVSWRIPDAPVLRRFASDDRPIRHLSWREADQFGQTFELEGVTAYHLVTPFLMSLIPLGVLNGSAGYARYVAAVRWLNLRERWLLAFAPVLRRFCWIVVVRVAKR